jgi:hypothetical protein
MIDLTRYGLPYRVAYVPPRILERVRDRNVTRLWKEADHARNRGEMYPVWPTTILGARNGEESVTWDYTNRLQMVIGHVEDYVDRERLGIVVVVSTGRAFNLWAPMYRRLCRKAGLMKFWRLFEKEELEPSQEQLDLALWAFKQATIVVGKEARFQPTRVGPDNPPPLMRSCTREVLVSRWIQARIDEIKASLLTSCAVTIARLQARQRRTLTVNLDEAIAQLQTYAVGMGARINTPPHRVATLSKASAQEIVRRIDAVMEPKGKRIRKLYDYLQGV